MNLLRWLLCEMVIGHRGSLPDRDHRGVWVYECERCGAEVEAD